MSSIPQRYIITNGVGFYHSETDDGWDFKAFRPGEADVFETVESAWSDLWGALKVNPDVDDRYDDMTLRSENTDINSLVFGLIPDDMPNELGDRTPSVTVPISIIDITSGEIADSTCLHLRPAVVLTAVEIPYNHPFRVQERSRSRRHNREG